ncbi:MAG: DinB family protein [Planctomycetaceae bacterium]
MSLQPSESLDADLMAAFADGCTMLRSAISGLSDEQLDLVPIPGKWSIRQVVCHLTDFEIISAARIQRIIAEENPTLFDADPDTFASRLAYGRRDVQDDLATIDALRRHMLRMIRCCELEDFQRTCVHSVDGPMTLEAIVERTARHIPHHVRFIEEKIAAMQ